MRDVRRGDCCTKTSYEVSNSLLRKRPDQLNFANLNEFLRCEYGTLGEKCSHKIRMGIEVRNEWSVSVW